MGTEAYPVKAHPALLKPELGLGIAVTGGLQQFELFGEGEKVLVGGEPHGVALVGEKILGGIVVADVAFQRFAESVEILRSHAHARRLRVSSECGEKLRMTGKQLKDVDARHRARRALISFRVLARKEDGGALELLDKPCRGDAEHPRLPLGVVQHDDACAVEIYASERPLRVSDHLFAYLLTAGVVAFQLLGEAFEHEIVLVDEKSHRLHRGAYAPRRVDARSEAEHDVLRGDLLTAREHLHSPPRGTREHPEPVPRYDAVVADERHDVRHRRDGADVEIILIFIPEERVYEPERHPRAAVVRKTFARDLGVHDDAVRQLSLRLMVIGDDEVDAPFFQKLRLFHRRDAAVHRDDEVGTAVRYDALESGDVHAVAVRLTVGDEVVRVRPAPEGEHEDGDRRDAVAVVVAEDEDLLSLLYGAAHPCRRLAHAVDLEGRREGVKGGRKERGDVRVREPAVPQQREKTRCDAEHARRFGLFSRKAFRHIPSAANAAISEWRPTREAPFRHFLFLNLVFFFEYL